MIMIHPGSDYLNLTVIIVFLEACYDLNFEHNLNALTEMLQVSI